MSAPSVHGGTSRVAVRARRPLGSRSTRLRHERRVTTLFEEIARFLSTAAIERGVPALPTLPERRRPWEPPDEAPVVAAAAVVPAAALAAEVPDIDLAALEHRPSA